MQKNIWYSVSKSSFRPKEEERKEQGIPNQPNVTTMTMMAAATDCRMSSSSEGFQNFRERETTEHILTSLPLLVKISKLLICPTNELFWDWTAVCCQESIVARAWCMSPHFFTFRGMYYTLHRYVQVQDRRPLF